MMSYGNEEDDCQFMHTPKRFKLNTCVVDLRSDSLTLPTPAMRQEMVEAQLGDDVFCEDPTVIELEETVARLFGKESALFVPTVTMGNLIAVMDHCNTRGSEAYCSEESDLVLNEQGAAASIAGVALRTLPNNADGTFDLDEFASKIRVTTLYEPISKLVVVENTISGRVVPQAWVEDLAALARKYRMKMHLDGARIWNVAVATGLSLQRLAKPFDSLCCSLSKSLGAPVGAVLCGGTSFVGRARRIRKALGGGMRQAGVLAAAGLVALGNMPRLKDDHLRAKAVAEAIAETGSDVFRVDLALVQTNVVTVRINSDSITAQDFVDRLEEIRDEDDEVLVVVRGMVENGMVRFVTYYEVTDKLVEAAVKKIKHVIRKFEYEL